MTIKYIVRRIGMFVLTIFLAITLNFFIPRLTPQDPIAALLASMASRGRIIEGGDRIIQTYQEMFGLNKPLIVQYFNYLTNLVLHGDLGPSLVYFPTKAQLVVLKAIPWTIGLLAVSTLISWVVGNVLGTILAWPKTKRWSRVLISLTMPFSAIPFYLLAMIVLYLLAIKFPIFPIGGSYTVGVNRGFDWQTFVDVVRHATLPALSLILSVLGFWVLSMRGVVTSILGDDFLIFARLRGLKEWRIFGKYAMRNAMLPQVTALGIDLGRLVSGQVLVEIIFNYPGVGSVLYRALRTADYFVIQGVVLFVIIAVALATLFLDLSYPLLDPRIKYDMK